jgi:tRNA pseudouridine38-40 synthase
VATARLDLEYDGSEFAGWARQPGQRTVQGELERALATVLRREVALTVAGRTDSGVHAWAQVASHDGEPAVATALNAVLPADIAVLGSATADDGFDARHHARSRTYCYRVLARRERSAFERRRALWWPHRVDLEALRACSAALVGTHDFTAFTPTQSEHVRFERDVLDARWEVVGDVLEFWITADAFLRHMNRALVGTMLEVAGDRRPLESFRTLLDGRPRAEAGDTAAAHGLFRAAVAY